MAYKNFKSTEIIEEIGVELRKIRLERNYTISYVAGQLCEQGLQISNTLLGRIENGERRIDDDTLNAICLFYRVSPSSVAISASEEHIRRLSEDNCDTETPSTLELEILYNDMNSTLKRLKAYMDAINAIKEQ